MRDQILARVKRLGNGKVFSARDFLDIASRALKALGVWRAQLV